MEMLVPPASAPANSTWESSMFKGVGSTRKVVTVTNEAFLIIHKMALCEMEARDNITILWKSLSSAGSSPTDFGLQCK